MNPSLGNSINYNMGWCGRCLEDFEDDEENKPLTCEDCGNRLCDNCADVDPEEEERFIGDCPICRDKLIKSNQYEKFTDYRLIFKNINVLTFNRSYFLG